MFVRYLSGGAVEEEVAGMTEERGSNRCNAGTL